MVRRWSYLEPTTLFSNTDKIARRHTFKVFRVTTRFRKYNVGLLRFVRRKNIKRKRNSSFLPVMAISVYWSKMYLHIRSIVRYSQDLSSSGLAYTAPSPQSLFRASKLNGTPFGLAFSSIASKRAKGITQFFRNFTLYNDKANNARNSLAQLLPAVRVGKHNSYLGLGPATDFESYFILPKKLNQLSTFNNMQSLFVKLTMSLVIEYYKLAIKLCLYYLHRD